MDHDAYDEPMSILPVSVRLALWATAAYAGRLPMQDVAGRAHPDIDHVDGDLDHLSLWYDVGERVVLVALPRPGKLSGMPRGSAELIAAATDAGECVFVPGVGGALVPTMQTFGTAGDQGTRVTWTAYDADPVQTYVLEALSHGAGPKKILVTLGYSGWGAGQLEDEMSRNGWINVNAEPGIIFDTPVEQRYDKALSLLGIAPGMLSQEAGHA